MLVLFLSNSSSHPATCPIAGESLLLAVTRDLQRPRVCSCAATGTVGRFVSRLNREMAKQFDPRGHALVALSLPLICTLFAKLSVLAAPQGQPDYSIVIPVDGIPSDDRYDFWLEGDDTFQIVDKSPGFSAIIEPPTFSQEAYAYSSPDCDLTKKIEYKQEFSHAKEGHTFWKRDLERDALDGRKYTFTMPPPEDLLDMVEFCLVITAPSKARDPDDPNIVFRRRLQDVESFYATEHSLTIVIHAGSQALRVSALVFFLTGLGFLLTS